MKHVINKPAKHYSPLRYPGGKASLSDYIGELIEINKINDCIYIEPFAGGAGAALTLLFQEKVDSIVINDLDKNVYSFWWSVLNKNLKFIEMIDKIEISVTEWRKQKEKYHDKYSNMFERGFAFFYLNRTNRSGIMSGGPIGGVNQNGSYSIDARFNKASLIEKVSKILNYKKRIELYNKDGLELISMFDNKKNTFTYLDPPYVVKGNDLYYNHYTLEDHKNLADNLLRKKSNWILSYDNNEVIRRLYKGKRYIEFDINYHADSHRNGNEMLIFSDSLKGLKIER
jgi:DNA adenine methylase